MPTEISGGKQSWIRIDRMKAWKATELTRELTAADPMAAVARNTGRYWRMYKQGLLVKLVNAALNATGLESHTLTVKSGGVTANQLIDVQQSALGDFSGKFGLLVIHSKIMAEYKKMGLLNYNKYTITNVLEKEVSLLHPNGLSFDADNIAKETPTDAEFTDNAKWKLKFEHKNVRMGKISIPKANFAEE